MLHTGRTLFHLDRNGEEIPAAHATLGESFRAVGYQTFGTGKWHNGRAAFARSFSGGDHIFFGGMDDHWNVPVYHYDPSGAYATRRPYIADPFHSNKVRKRECDHLEPGKHSTDLFTDAALRFLGDRDTDKPFFLYVSLMAPHDPRSMPAEYLERYAADSLPLPGNFLPQHPYDTGALDVRDEKLAAMPRDPDEVRHHLAEYYAMISHLDDALGKILQTLAEQGELDNTVIVFAGDNGLALGQHGLMGKQSLYEHSVRVPLVLAGPGIPVGTRSDALVYLLDLFPTLADLCDFPLPASVEGRSFLPCLRDPQTPHRDILYLAYADSLRGLSDGSHKLIEYAAGDTQLFDLDTDPLETRNLADDPAQAERLDALRASLWQRALLENDPDHPCGKIFWSRRVDLQGPHPHAETVDRL